MHTYLNFHVWYNVWLNPYVGGLHFYAIFLFKVYVRFNINHNLSFCEWKERLFGSKSDYNGRLVTSPGAYLETVLWAISHLITWQNMLHSHFCPLHAPWRWRSPKYGYFRVKIHILWQGGPRAVGPTWKMSNVPYNISLHGKTCIRTICALKTHPWFGPLLSTFGCLEVSLSHNFSFVWRDASDVPAPFKGI